MNRRFSLTHTVRYDECDYTGFLTPASFFRYMQDIAARDAKDSQLGGDGYWIVKRTVISFAAPIPVHSELLLTTYGIGFSRITAQRGYEARFANAPQEEPLVSARTLWVYVDRRGRPARLPERTAEIWMPDGVLPPQSEPAFPAFPAEEPLITAATVSFSEIDPMQHLNNAAAIELLDNAGWEALASRGLSPTSATCGIQYYDVEYDNSPRFGEQLHVENWFVPFPSHSQELTRFQRITREDKTMVRAVSRWFWHTTPV